MSPRADRAIARAANELVPQLTERLEQHGLGEIEVRHGDLRVRVAAASEAGRQAPGGPRAVASSISGVPTAPRPAQRSPWPRPPSRSASPRPAVGFFAYADGLGPGPQRREG